MIECKTQDCLESLIMILSWLNNYEKKKEKNQHMGLEKGCVNKKGISI